MERHECTRLYAASLGGDGILCAGGMTHSGMTEGGPVHFLPATKNADGTWQTWRSLNRLTVKYVRIG